MQRYGACRYLLTCLLIGSDSVSVLTLHGPQTAIQNEALFFFAGDLLNQHYSAGGQEFKYVSSFLSVATRSALLPKRKVKLYRDCFPVI